MKKRLIGFLVSMATMLVVASTAFADGGSGNVTPPPDGNLPSTGQDMYVFYAIALVVIAVGVAPRLWGAVARRRQASP